MFLARERNNGYGGNMDVDHAKNKKRIDMGAKPYTFEWDNIKKWMWSIDLTSGWDEI